MITTTVPRRRAKIERGKSCVSTSFPRHFSLRNARARLLRSYNLSSFHFFCPPVWEFLFCGHSFFSHSLPRVSNFICCNCNCPHSSGERHHASFYGKSFCAAYFSYFLESPAAALLLLNCLWCCVTRKKEKGEMLKQFVWIPSGLWWCIVCSFLAIGVEWTLDSTLWRSLSLELIGFNV